VARELLRNLPKGGGKKRRRRKRSREEEADLPEESVAIDDDAEAGDEPRGAEDGDEPRGTAEDAAGGPREPGAQTGEVPTAAEDGARAGGERDAGDIEPASPPVSAADHEVDDGPDSGSGGDDRRAA
ncbi:MAG: hypothetical protein KJ006_13135, partial [Thermoleophilia bacterium]|nr:hypothetical protein [Thermoleophilia bacterium]